MKQHVVRDFRSERFTANGVSDVTFEDVFDVLKSDLCKDQGPCAMGVMLQLIHSSNHKTSIPL